MIFLLFLNLPSWIYTYLRTGNDRNFKSIFPPIFLNFEIINWFFIYIKIDVTIYSFNCLFRGESSFKIQMLAGNILKIRASSEIFIIFRSIFKVEFIFNKRSGGSKSFILKKCYFVFTYYFKYKIKLYIVELTNVTHI